MKISIKNIMTLSPLKISIVLVILALVVFFMDPHFLRFMELKALDLRMVSRGQLPTTGQVIIATVDEKSLSEIGRWPWSRSMTAKLVDSLKEYGAKAVGFDIVFAEPEQSACPSADAILAKSVKSAKNVSLGYFGSSLKSMGNIVCNMIEIRHQEMEEVDTDRDERHRSFSVGFGFETAVASGFV